MTQIISFCSGKGGVGKTTLVANLGLLLAKKQKTLLIDADWNLGKLSIALGVRPLSTWNSILKFPENLSDSVQKISENLFLLASPSGVIGLEEMPFQVRGQLYFEIEKLASQYDVVLFDHSSGIHPDVLEFAAPAQKHMIVTTVEPTSYTDAYAIMKLLSKRFGIREFNLIATQSQNLKNAEKVLARFLDVTRQHLNVGVDLLSIIPWDVRLTESIQKRKPFVTQFPQDSLTKYFTQLIKTFDRIPQYRRSGMCYGYQPETTV